MTDEERYPQRLIDVEVIYIDGEVAIYTITADLGLAQYLAKDAAAAGVLTLMNEQECHGIPLTQIRSYRLHNERDIQ